MSAKLLSGRDLSSQLRDRVRTAAAELANDGIRVALSVVIVGEDPASVVYVRNKVEQATSVGIEPQYFRLPVETSQAEVLALVEMLNGDDSVDGILVQLPLPPHIDAFLVMSSIAPPKDVDGFHPTNAGNLAIGKPSIVPCTPLGCLMLIQEARKSLVGLNAVVVGHSNIVGKPMARLLLAEGCTVTVAHKATVDVPSVCRTADILVVAVGQPELIRGSWIRGGAIVIDVGINQIDRNGRRILVGDVAFDEAVEVAAAITPVPGGVGPMTIACLLSNTIEAACQRRGVLSPMVAQAAEENAHLEVAG
ncbi:MULTISPECIES: bifunctional 5,10-methylenetetrahydrofolate dehydrogenase/5,10-methenyltetrahydrofolate cyclohydrolase [unclassified Xanthobacter]|uniref:bifunctional 5,10-methylenetetrahydrofolate dehydrogenase/5,10-methenyltetrahydrofolate cyclohydrolase n=1 Tax=unclassified Xanthobacter TaxID=2623496 RepID=UPI001EDFDEBE|nr:MULTISPECIES: bifunctional methylenetetrahydrofolate dehydrogenase/methenyltetrahydrofolate cyclohydrolase FolD [unclassified Xanthobacter]